MYVYIYIYILRGEFHPLKLNAVGVRVKRLALIIAYRPSRTEGVETSRIKLIWVRGFKLVL